MLRSAVGIAVIIAATALAACARPITVTPAVDDLRCAAARMPFAAVMRVGDPCADETVEVRAVAWSASSNAFAFASSEHVTVVSSEDARPIAELELPGLAGIALSEYGRWLVAMTSDDGPPALTAWDLEQTPPRPRSLGHGAAAFGPRGTTMIVDRGEGVLDIVAADTSSILAQQRDAEPETDLDAATFGRCGGWSADGLRFVAVRGDRLLTATPIAGKWTFTALVVPIERSLRLRDAPPLANHGDVTDATPVCAVDASGRLRLFAVDRQMTFDDTAKDGPTITVTPRHDPITPLADPPAALDGAIAAGARLRLRLRGAKTDELLSWPSPHRGHPLVSAVSPSGELVATYGQDGVAYVWRIGLLRLLARPPDVTLPSRHRRASDPCAPPSR